MKPVGLFKKLVNKTSLVFTTSSTYMSSTYARYTIFTVFSIVLLNAVFFSENSYSLERDPTTPAIIETKKGDETEIMPQVKQLVLSAIFISGNQKTAVIDNKIVKVGDRLGNKKVNYIGHYSVKLNENGKLITLYIFGKPYKETQK